MKQLIFLVGLLGVLISCNPQQPNPEELKQVLFDYFDGIKNKDINKMNSVTTTDFVLFENGQLYTNDTLINHLSKFSKLSIEYRFENITVNANDKIGTVHYFNNGVFIINDTSRTERKWLESGSLRNEDGKWKLYFLHSSPRK